MANKKAGKSTVNNIKASNYLPQVFQTDLNKNWLDSTLDQMISKSPLSYIEGYVGSKAGADRTVDDVYLQTQSTQLSPTLVSRDTDGNIAHAITFDDIKNNISQNFSTYNYNSAYNTQLKVMLPPIDIDKFVNFRNYYWVNQLPTYESIFTGSSKNPVALANDQVVYTLEDDNNTFAFENNMIIKFTGTGYDSSIRNKTYLVSGVGTKIKMILFRDENNNSKYINVAKHSQKIAGYWDDSKITNVSPNTNSPYWQTKRQALGIINAYNSDQNRLPLFEGFIFDGNDANTDIFVFDKVVKFNSKWTNIPASEKDNLYYLERESNGDVKITLLADQNGQVAGLDSFYQAVLADLESWDTSFYDYEDTKNIVKDYIVVARNDSFYSAWSRTNSWTHLSTINKVQELTGIDLKHLRSQKRQASRNIIETNANIEMFNHAEYTSTSQDMLIVDFAITSGQESQLPSNATYIIVDNEDNVLLTGNGSSVSVANNTTLFVKNIIDGQNLDWSLSDVYVKDNKFVLAQQKTKVNQYPLYNVFSQQGSSYRSLDGVISKPFVGQKIFGYKEGNSYVDPELGLKLSYQDSPTGANIVFENFLLTAEYNRLYESMTEEGLSYVNNILGDLHYKIENDYRGTYINSNSFAGSTESFQYVKENSPYTSVVLPYGYSSWRQELAVFLSSNYDKKCTELKYKNGQRLKQLDNELALIPVDYSFDIVNLTGEPVDVVMSDGTTPASNGITFSNNKITCDQTTNNKLFKIVYTNTNEVALNAMVSNTADLQYHSIKINGKQVNSNDYVIDQYQTSLNVDLETNDIVDLEWHSNTANSVPTIIKNNANNKKVTEFTISETLAHWTDMISSNPNFDGDTLGYNNSASIANAKTYFGDIFVHDDISTMHDMCYADNTTSVTGSLFEAGKDWDTFKARFKSQVQRLYKTTAGKTVDYIVSEAINTIIKTNRNNLHAESNMVYAHTNSIQQFEVDGTTNRFKTRYTFNADRNIRDHVYVYLTDNVNGLKTKRLLTKDVDYTFVGKTITLLVTTNNMPSGENPTVEVLYHNMDSECLVPPSLAKLGLVAPHVPRVHGNKIYGHDGCVYQLTPTAELLNINSVDFDIVNAAMFELEKRVYAGLIKHDAVLPFTEKTFDERYKSAYWYYPSTVNYTWYNNNLIDNHIETYFKAWYNKKQLTTLTPDNYFDNTDPFTWNYSSITLHDGMSNVRLPGHWMGAYINLFATNTPHITPWHMLGFSFKPTWWDTHYSWTDPVKRAALIDALQNGIISEPGTSVVQDTKFARHNWDFAQQCPVKTDGTLEDPNAVIGVPTEAARAQNFVFGDWGPVEIEWRQTAQAQALMIDAVVKLTPARAWSDFFQPGYIQSDTTTCRFTNTQCCANSYKHAGHQYGKVVKSVTINDTLPVLPNNTDLKIMDNTNCRNGKVSFELESDGTVDAFSVAYRGCLYNETPTIVGITPMYNSDISIEIGECLYVANGIAQAQYNYSKRNQTENNFKQFYDSIDVNLTQGVEGYTNKNLLKIETDSSQYGKVVIDQNDYDIITYRSNSDEIVTASAVFITKKTNSFVVSGISDTKQEFKFYEPSLANATAFETIDINGAQVKKYKNFSQTESIAEFGASFSKVQDVYNFVRGYWTWMESNGYELEFNKDASAIDFVTWSFEADIEDTLVLQIGRNIKFNNPQGTVLEYNTQKYNSNNISTIYNTQLNANDLSVTRQGETVSISTKELEFIGSISTAVVNYEHMLVFKNTTDRNVKLFDGSINFRQQRLHLSGQKTNDWTGKLKAPGYLVFDDHIVENFDSSVQSVDNHYRTDVDEFNSAIAKTKDLSIGNFNRDWINNLNLNKNTVTQFFQGAVKNKATPGVIEALDRTTLINGGLTDVKMYEQYMFRQSDLGYKNDLMHFEFTIDQNRIKGNPQVFSTSSTNQDDILIQASDIVSGELTQFDTAEFNELNGTILTGGEPLETETNFKVLSMLDLPGVFNSEAEYANYETWTDTKSYKKGDIVRYKGKLYQCAVDFTGLEIVTENIQVIGDIPLPTFPYGTHVNIAGTTTVLESSTTNQETIVVDGSVQNPIVIPSDTLVIDNVNITLQKSENVLVVTGPALLTATSGPAIITDVTNRAININGVSIDFDTTPANVVETFTGADNGTPTITTAQETFVATAAQAVFSLTADLDANVVVTDVTLDGTPVSYTTDDTNNTVTLNTPAVGGELVSVDIETTTVNLQDTFVVNQPLGFDGTDTWQVKNITVNGTATTAYSISGQQITFSTAPANGANIEITLGVDPRSMTTSDIVSAINGANIAGLTVNTVGSENRLELVYQTTNPTQNLVLGANSTNTLLGFQPSGAIVRQATQVQQQDANMTIDDVVAAINNSVTLSNVTASNQGNVLRLTSTNSNLTVSGSAVPKLGITGAIASTTTIPIDTSMTTAINEINQTFAQQNINDIFVSSVGNRIQITTTRDSIDIGNTQFNTRAGLPINSITANEGDVSNTFDVSNWNDISRNDPAIITVLVSDDSLYEVETRNNVKTKFFGYNVFQTTYTSHLLYTQPHTTTDLEGNEFGCGICAGTSSRDGNDAEITTQVDHGLQVGDYVMLLNTTTTPNIDGIHKVTKLGTGEHANMVFYIDEYIEKCGNSPTILPLRTRRFDTLEDRDLFNSEFITGDLAWVDNVETRGTHVYTATRQGDSTTWTQKRTTTRRPTNKNVESIIIYDKLRNTTVAEFEAFDPIRGIIPGSIEINIDITEVNDTAIYNNSSDDTYQASYKTPWTEDQLGVRWWDTKTLRYFDYDQGASSYKALHWGKLYPGSEIVIWEWTKSTVLPDDYQNAVENSNVMFGQVATGEAYFVYDVTLDEKLYYYSEAQSWNSKTKKYETVYYFWVKNKESIVTDNRTMSVRDTSIALADPSANGILWYGCIDSDSFIINNLRDYITSKNQIIQINYTTDKKYNHNEWMLITKDRDNIQEYWVERMKENLAGVDSNDNSIPYTTLHSHNKYGNDKQAGQSWFVSLPEARKSAIVAINDILSTINIWDDLHYTWDTELIKGNFPDHLWSWKDYTDKTYIGTLNHTVEISHTNDLDGVDTALHTVARLTQYDLDNQLDRSEVYYYNDSNWILVHKSNATIEFDAEALSGTGYDTYGWDSKNWDYSNLVEEWRTIIASMYNDIFVAHYSHHRNELFFVMVYHVLGTHVQTNWIRKTTYIKVDLISDFDTQSRKYKKDSINEVIGYVETVKPFHTKVSTLTDIHKITEDVTLTFSEDVKQHITLRVEQHQPVFGFDVYNAGDDWSTEVDTTIDAGDNWVDTNTLSDSVTLDNGNFINDINYNYNNYNDNRNELVSINPYEHVTFIVQTNTTGNTVDADTRTFLHQENDNMLSTAFALEQASLTTLDTSIVDSSMSFDVADGSVLEDSGLLLVGSEIVSYNRQGNTVFIVERSINNTLQINHNIGEQVIDITDKQISGLLDKQLAASQFTLRYNEQGSRLSTSDTVASQQLSTMGQGYEL